MVTSREKAARVFGTPAAARKGPDTQSIGATRDNNKLSTLKARFALRGHTLQAENRAGREPFVVSSWGQARTFSYLGDAVAFLGQNGGVKCRPSAPLNFK